MPRGTKAELLGEAVRLMQDLNENELIVCLSLKNNYDGLEWCPHDCPGNADEGCVLHLLRKRIERRKNETEEDWGEDSQRIQLNPMQR
ncbi:MAG: hypothetical protein IIV20_01590 [Bacteroidaceae bacterium]|nr:hypothetical protein [Bacteroidaceae bacterium]